jgi:uncharacterized protein YndB with AHSA1/START domain
MSKKREATAENSVKSSMEKKDREFVMERVFNAPRELVWQAWSQPEHLKHWWGPKHWTLPVCRVDFRPGGIWHYCMRGPNGEESWGRAVYREIVEPERIVYKDSFSDAEGNTAEGMPEMVITVTFDDMDGKTKVTARALFETAEDLETVLDMGMVEGLTQTWDRLEAYLAEV